MLPKQYRLKKNAHFNFVYKKGSKSFSKALTLVFVKTKYSFPKVGFSISKKIGNAVQRNLIKRRLRSILKDSLPNLSMNYNYVFVAKEGIAELSFSDLCNEVKALLQKSGVWNE